MLKTKPLWQIKIAQALGSDEPALRLWAAVLNDAIAALCGRHPGSRNHGRHDCRNDWLEEEPEVLWREAVAWILSRDDEPLGTFESVCSVLDLPTAIVRRDLCALAVHHAPYTSDSEIAGFATGFELDLQRGALAS